MNLFGIDVLQFFNPMYIIIGVLMVLYFWIVGSCIKTFSNKFKIGSISVGFLTTMFAFGMIFILFRFLNLQYKELFIAFIITTSSFSILRIIKSKTKFNLQKLIIISSSVVITFFVTAILSNWKDAILPNHDYWLYGKFLTNGSNFLGILESKANIYALSNFYDFIGSFIGMINGPIEGFVGGLDVGGNYFENIVYVAQVPMMIVLISLIMDVAYQVSDKKRYLIIALACAQFILPFQTGMIGSFLLFIPFTFIMIDIKKNRFSSLMALFYIIPFVFFNSSISFLLPFIAVLILVLERRIKISNCLPILVTLLALALAGQNPNGEMQIDFEVMVLFYGVVAVFALQKWLLKIWDKLIDFTSKKDLVTKIVLCIFILSYVLTTPLPSNVEFATTLSIFVGRTIFSFVSLFVLFRWMKSNKNFRNYLLVAIIFVNPIINLISTTFNILEKIPVIYHRIGNIILIGEMYMNIGCTVLFMFFAIEVINIIKKRRGE